MTIEENDHIDQSEFLPNKLEYEYPHRLAKPDISRNNGTYTSTLSMLLIDLLLDRGIVNYDHHRAAIFLMSLRRAISNSLGLERVFQNYLRLPSEDVQVYIIAPSVLRMMLERGLKPHQLNIVRRITSLPRADDDRESRPMTDNDVEWMSRCLVSVRESLDIVKRNLDSYLEIRKSGCSEGTTTTPSV
jgi:hypothetical protein